MKRTGVVALLALLCMAPTPGDVGGCGSEVEALDPTAFAFARKDEDCRRCTECGISSARCERACDPASSPETVIPATCLPLHHDGVVCLRALRAASCSAYATYVDEHAPVTPSECAFCRVAPTAPPPSFARDASVEVAP